jgi:hypothetical protein
MEIFSVVLTTIYQLLKVQCVIRFDPIIKMEYILLGLFFDREDGDMFLRNVG